MKKITLYAVATALVMGLCFTATSFANDKGPAEMTLTSAKAKKPAVFPHAAHQEKLACGECHHSKDTEGKQVAYVEGQKIEKCETCHNDSMTNKKLASFKDVGHANCKECHKTTDKKLAKCDVCHPKK